MATQTEPATDALYQALSSPEPDPQVVHAAIEEIRYLSGHNVIAAIEAKIDVLAAKIDSQGAELGTKIDALNGKIDSQSAELSARIDAVNSRIDTLQRVIWPLVVLLASTVFGLLYRVFTPPV